MCWRTLIPLLLVVELAAASTAFADVRFDAEMPIDGHRLLLRGTALKEATFFAVNVYTVALYVEEEVTSTDALLSGDHLTVIVLEFMRDLSRRKLAELWMNDLRRSCQSGCDSLLSSAGRLAAGLPDVTQGQRVTFVAWPDRVDVSARGDALGSLHGREATRSVIRAFVGPRSPKALRTVLLASFTKGNGRR